MLTVTFAISVNNSGPAPTRDVCGTLNTAGPFAKPEAMLTVKFWYGAPGAEGGVKN